VEKVYKEDLKDVQLARMSRKEYLKNPARAVDALAYFQKRKKSH